MADVKKKAPEKAGVKAAVGDERKKALEAALQQIEKNYGKGAVMRLGQNVGMNVECIPTGSMALDAALGIGGLPRGRIVEIYGQDHPGAACRGGGPEEGRRGGVHRRGARPRSGVRRGPGGGRGLPAGLPAGHR